MLCIPVVGPSLFEVKSQLEEAKTLGKIVEFRLDLFDEETLKNLKLLKNTFPIIFTLRKKEQGGHFKGSEEERLKKVREYAAFQPDYFDLEYDISLEFLESFQKDFPNIKVILSFHDFSKTPENLDELLKNLKSKRASYYKIACMANSTNDALRMLDLVQRNLSLLGMSMGEKGQITRILGLRFGAPWIYASLNRQTETASGQIAAQDLLSLYQIQRLNQRTELFGLIGNPLDKSIGKWVHNAAFRTLECDAIYVNMTLNADELTEFFPLVKKLGFKGLSVTIPLKESVLPFMKMVDKEAKEMGAVNTLLFKEEGLLGFNTDGVGAIDAIEQKISVKSKKIFILGAGGASRAIAYVAGKRKAIVTILNRTKERALLLAKSLGIKGEGLDFLEKELDYDVLINTTPDELPIDPKYVKPKTVVMDIKPMPKMTKLLQHALNQECLLVYGYEMWVGQAIGQYDIWFSSRFNKDILRQIFEKERLMRV